MKKNFWCKILGHRVDDIDVAMFLIKKSAINKENFKGDKVECKRCKAVIYEIV